MDLGTFRELTKDMDDFAEVYISLGTVYKGDKIVREEIEAEIKSVEEDEDGSAQGRKIVWINAE